VHVPEPSSQQNWADYIDSLYIFNPPTMGRRRPFMPGDGLPAVLDPGATSTEQARAAEGNAPAGDR